MTLREVTELAGQPSRIESHQSLNDYLAALAVLDSLRPRAEQITERLRPYYKSVYVDDFDAENVGMICYYANHDTDNFSFPAEWLFALDWERLVDERLAKEAREKEETEQREVQAVEEREREQLRRLSAKYQS